MIRECKIFFQEVDIMLKYVETNKAPAAIGPYSQGIVVNGTAFFSGQIPLSPETGEVIGTTIREQTEQVMKNIQDFSKAKTLLLQML